MFASGILYDRTTMSVLFAGAAVVGLAAAGSVVAAGRSGRIAPAAM